MAARVKPVGLYTRDFQIGTRICKTLNMRESIDHFEGCANGMETQSKKGEVKK